LYGADADADAASSSEEENEPDQADAVLAGDQPHAGSLEGGAALSSSAFAAAAAAAKAVRARRGSREEGTPREADARGAAAVVGQGKRQLVRGLDRSSGSICSHPVKQQAQQQQPAQPPAKLAKLSNGAPRLPCCAWRPATPDPRPQLSS
jgi:hypothetical protein